MEALRPCPAVQHIKVAQTTQITACFRGVDKRISSLEDQAGEINALLTKTKIRQFRHAKQLTIYGLPDPTIHVD